MPLVEVSPFCSFVSVLRTVYICACVINVYTYPNYYTYPSYMYIPILIIYPIIFLTETAFTETPKHYWRRCLDPFVPLLYIVYIYTCS